MAESYPMIIDGKERLGEHLLEVVNPATEEVIATVPECGAATLDEAVNAASRAFASFSREDSVRRELLAKAAKVVFDNVDRLASLLTSEQGKPLQEAKAEVIGAGVWFKYFSDLELPEEVIQDDATARVKVLRRPIGVTAAITPWNFPLILSVWKLAPALRAGNTLVVKPSPFTPLATVELARLLQDVFDPGVVNVVTGSDEVGKRLVAHPLVRKVSFTGSVAAGKHVNASAAPDLKRVTLELGGNDPAIVLEDVEVSEIAEPLFWGAFMNNGQVCSAVKRVYVHRSKYADLVDALAQIAKSVKVGNGMEEGVRLGPVNNRPQFERVKLLVEEALSSGGRAAAGGGPLPGKGFFFAPTILSDVSDEAPIVKEEQFGPALPVLPYDRIEEAIERANATMYGLSGSVWGKDPERARAVAERLECGTVWVNSHLVLAPHQPFGGMKWSGLGVENGPWGLYSFTEIKVLWEKKA
jgi:acyl-CoA reductase-like NAD-dependent aldehyde dehydrogenase